MTDHDRVIRTARDLVALGRLTDEKFAARDRAINEVAREAQRAREQANEWRGSLNDLSNTKIDKEAFETFRTSIEDKFDKLSEEVVQQRGAGRGQQRTYALLLAVVGGAVGLIGLVVAVASYLSR